jgi:hypothetical protein
MRIRRNNIMADIIIDKAHQMEEVRRTREFVKNKLYPALIKNDESIDETKFFLSSMSNLIMTEFLTWMREKKFSELHLEDKLDPASPQYENYKEFVELFKDESIFNTKELLDGMKGEIQMILDNETKGRKLDTLKTDFL